LPVLQRDHRNTPELTCKEQKLVSFGVRRASGREMTETTTPSGGRATAPGDLALVQAFVNTVDIETGEERFATAAALASWLTERGLLHAGATASSGDLADAVRLREALRAMLYANCCSEPGGGDAAAALDALATRCPLAVRVGEDGRLQLQPLVAGVAGALGRLLAIVYRAEAAGTWARLKACREQSCRWAFYDASKNRSGAWCDMAVCGNRAKVRAYQRRRGG
jgi:predicted RNA-binding Zn ribbon-like protein